MCALSLEPDLCLPCSTVQKQLISFVTKLPSLQNGRNAQHGLHEKVTVSTAVCTVWSMSRKPPVYVVLRVVSTRVS